MRRLELFARDGFAILAVGVVCVACAAFRQEARTVLTANEMACILAHGYTSSIPILARECVIAEALVPALQELLQAEHIAASQKAGGL